MQGNDFNDVLTLMRAQDANINQAVQYIFPLYNDLSLAGNRSFQGFTLNFYTFILNHGNSEGFTKAIEAQQIYNYILLEKLLSTQVLLAAEHLETAISHLELVERMYQTRITPNFLLLNHTITLLEETELKIIETLESILKSSYKIPLQN
ncbi:hypothetical protein SDC9_06004 [bioreactor metagenome]|uniref:Uncharacterized protein n=1 Tax=bioreactor metagenome TaxID=1076179 RepID=A0A644T0K4_9ZZZZ|nr:hypothetical protein [Negativicutes bacterium]